MRRRSNAPPVPLPPPGDLSWSPAPVGGSTHLIRSDGIEVFLRPNGFTIARSGHPLDQTHVVAVLELLGLTPADVLCTYARTETQREYSCTHPALAWLVAELARG